MDKMVFRRIGAILLVVSALYGAEETRVWPTPPDPARFSYIKSVSGADDMEIKRGFWGKIWDYLAGNESKVLRAPMGLYLAADGKMYVTDSAQHAVFIFDPAENSMDVWDGYDGERFGSLIDVVADGEGRVYLTDALVKTVIVLDRKGKLVRKIGEGAAMERPTGMAINAQLNRLYVTDTLKGTIEVFSPEGQHLKTIGGIGNGDGEFNRPTYIALDDKENLYVSDSMNHRIQIFDAEGNFLRKFGKLGGKVGSFGSPRGVALDADGNIYVTDSLLHALQIFDTNGNLLLVIGQYGNEKGEFSSPKDIAIDAQGRVVIADFYNMRLQMLQKLPNPEKRELP